MLGHARIWEETVKSNPLLARKDAITPVLIPAKGIKSSSHPGNYGWNQNLTFSDLKGLSGIQTAH